MYRQAYRSRRDYSPMGIGTVITVVILALVAVTFGSVRLMAGKIGLNEYYAARKALELAESKSPPGTFEEGGYRYTVTRDITGHRIDVTAVPTTLTVQNSVLGTGKYSYYASERGDVYQRLGDRPPIRDPRNRAVIQGELVTFND